MATAREKTLRITERIPHKDVSYAYLELEAPNVNEFASLRAEALASEALSHYAFAADAPAERQTAEDFTTAKQAVVKSAAAAARAKTKKSAVVQTVDEPAEGEEGEESGSDDSTVASDAPVAPTSPAQSDGLTARERARQRLEAKRGAK